MLLPLSAIPDGTAVEAKKANVGLTTYREGVHTMRKLNPRNWLPNVKMNYSCCGGTVASSGQSKNDKRWGLS